MRHSLFRYFDQRQWADAFLNGNLLFRPLSYFRSYEDQIRGDTNEGVAVFEPAGGLVITNHTKGTTFTLPGHRLESAVRQDEIFVYCLSRVRTAELAAEFGSIICVEIRNIPEFCRRVQVAMPVGAEYVARRVEYYKATDAANPRWALPDMIAMSKLDVYSRQAEFRLAFSTTGAMDFENVTLQLVHGDGEPPPRPPAPDHHPVLVGSLWDICRLHEISRS